MDVDDGVGAPLVEEGFFGGRGYGVGALEGEPAVHLGVEVDGYAVAYAACAQVVHAFYAVDAHHGACDAALVSSSQHR